MRQEEVTWLLVCQYWRAYKPECCSVDVRAIPVKSSETAMKCGCRSGVPGLLPLYFFLESHMCLPAFF